MSSTNTAQGYQTVRHRGRRLYGDISVITGIRQLQATSHHSNKVPKRSTMQSYEQQLSVGATFAIDSLMVVPKGIRQSFLRGLISKKLKGLLSKISNFVQICTISFLITF